MRLCLILLTGEVPEGFVISRVGALSKARWMSKAIAAIKLVLLKAKIFSELPPNRIMTQAQAVLIERFVKFIILPWVKWWIRCPLAAEADLVDLELLRDIRAFPDPTVSRATEKAFHLHLWYLTEVFSPLALFSS